MLRVETTIHDASGLKVYRPVGDDPEGELKWQKLRKGWRPAPAVRVVAGGQRTVLGGVGRGGIADAAGT